MVKPDEYHSKMINLQSDFDTFLAYQDDKYTYKDSYFDTCLNKISVCRNGTTWVFNLNLLYPVKNDKTNTGYNYGRTVLFSSGGDSPYTTGGHYLHQINARGEDYIEFGLSVQNTIFQSKVKDVSFNISSIE